jgi:hypothetical protein
VVDFLERFIDAVVARAAAQARRRAGQARAARVLELNARRVANATRTTYTPGEEGESAAGSTTAAAAAAAENDEDLNDDDEIWLDDDGDVDAPDEPAGVNPSYIASLLRRRVDAPASDSPAVSGASARTFSLRPTSTESVPAPQQPSGVQQVLLHPGDIRLAALDLLPQLHQFLDQVPAPLAPPTVLHPHQQPRPVSRKS